MKRIICLFSKLKLLIIIFFPLLAITPVSHGQIEWVDYPGKLKEEYREKVQFGYMTVPENHDQPEGRKIQVAFSLLKGDNDNNQEAVIYLPGGPGGSFTNATGDFLNLPPIQAILEQKDIVLLDPRGCGNSRPTLCDNLNKLEIAYSTIFGKNKSEMEALHKKEAKICRDSLRAANLDPSAYSSVAVAHDVEMLRKALNYQQWIMRGHSYGSYYSQAIIHHYSESVKAAILSGLVPKKRWENLSQFSFLSQSIHQVIAACEQDSACDGAFPDLENRFFAVLKSLQEDPMQVTGVSEEPIMIDARVFMDALFLLMYSQDGIEIVPLMVKLVEEDITGFIQSLAKILTSSPIENDMLIIISNNDKSGPEKIDASSLKDSFSKMLYQYYGDEDYDYIFDIYKEVLNLQPHSFDTTKVIYDTPVLLFDGRYDPVTPPANTDKVAAYFPNHFKFTVSDRGHDASASIDNIIPDYVLNPNQQPDLSELDELEGLQFETDVTYNQGISALAAKVITGNYLTTAIVAGILLLMVLIGFFYFPVRFLVRKLRKKPATLPVSVNLTTWMVTLLAIGFVALLVIALMDTMATNSYLMVFGLSVKWTFIFIIPWLLVTALFVSLYFSKNVWQTSTGNKIFWSVSWLGGLGMVVFLWINGLIW